MMVIYSTKFPGHISLPTNTHVWWLTSSGCWSTQPAAVSEIHNSPAACTRLRHRDSDVIGTMWRVQPHNKWNKTEAQYIRYCVNTLRSAAQYSNAARCGRHALTGFILRFSRYISLNRKTLQTRSWAVFRHVICRGCTNLNIHNTVSAAEYIITDITSNWPANSSKIFICQKIISQLTTRCDICVALMWGVTGELHWVREWLSAFV
jgi:hypothetical protein